MTRRVERRHQEPLRLGRAISIADGTPNDERGRLRR